MTLNTSRVVYTRLARQNMVANDLQLILLGVKKLPTELPRQEQRRFTSASEGKRHGAGGKGTTSQRTA
jgi:hypothetical protein